MVKAVDHDFGSETATTVGSTAKGALKWLVGVPLVVGVVAALVGGGIAAIPALELSAKATAVLAGAAAWGKTGLVLGAIATFMAAPLVAMVGAVFGFSKGRDKISQEQSKFDREQAMHSGRVASHSQAMNAQMQQAAEMGYAQGARDMHTQMLQQYQQAMIAQNMAVAANENAKACAPTTKHTDAENKRREAAAAAGIQRN